MTLAKISNLIYQFGPLILASASIIGVVGGFARYRYKIRVRKRKLRKNLLEELEVNVVHAEQWIDLEEEFTYADDLFIDSPFSDPIYRANLDDLGFLSTEELRPLILAHNLIDMIEKEYETVLDIEEASYGERLRESIIGDEKGARNLMKKAGKEIAKKLNEEKWVHEEWKTPKEMSQILHLEEEIEND